MKEIIKLYKRALGISGHIEDRQNKNHLLGTTKYIDKECVTHMR